jgi:proliferating cell nuclear antigen
MKISLTNKQKVSKLVAIFRNLKDLVTDVNIHVSNEEVYIQSMDGSHVCLIEVKIQTNWFDDFTIKNEEVLGVNTEILFKVIDCWKDGQEITLETKGKTCDKLIIRFSGENQIFKEFELPLVEIDTDIMMIPDKEYEVDLALNSSDLKDLVNELAIFNEDIEIKCSSKDEKVIINSSGGMGKMKVEIKEDDILEFAISEDLELSVSYAISYINKMCDFNKVNNIVYMHSSNEDPLKFHYSLDDEDSVNSENFVRFYLAPKIEEEF